MKTEENIHVINSNYIMKYSFLSLSCAAALLLTFPCTTIHAQTLFKKLDFEDAAINSNSWQLSDNLWDLEHQLKGSPNKPALVSGTKYRGSYSLRYWCPANTNTSQTHDKSEYHLVKAQASETEPLRLMDDSAYEDGRYVGFAIRFDSNFTRPDDDYLFYQCWQDGGNSPPLSLQLTPNYSESNGSVFKLKVILRNDGNTNDPVIVYPGKITRGVWNEFILYLRPSHTSDDKTGKVKLWQNGTLLLDRTMDWGYRPESKGGTATVKDTLTVCPTMYRRRQNLNHQCFFDEVRYGDTYGIVDP
jgi:hypothetical protein